MLSKVAAYSMSKTLFSEQKNEKVKKNGPVDHFQPLFLTLFVSERQNFERVSDRTEPKDYFSYKKSKLTRTYFERGAKN